MSRKTIIVVVVFCLLLALMLWLGKSPRRQTSLLADTSTPQQAVSTTNKSTTGQKLQSNTWTRPADVDDAGWKYLSTVRERMLASNYRVDFHARAIDQSGRGVPNARLELRLAYVDVKKVMTEFPHMKMGSEIANKNISITSDADGWFHLVNESGKILVVNELVADGCVWGHSGYVVLNYDGKNPDADFKSPSRGIIFHLWKKGDTERLIPINIGVNLDVESSGQWVSNYFVRFVPPQVSWTNFEGADLIIKGVRRLNGNPDRPFEFTFTFSFLKGGVVISDDAYPYQAPKTGYQTEWSFDNKPQNNPADFPWTKTCYFKLRGGKFVVGTKMGFCNGGFDFSFNGYLNPSGSRNLEPDPAKLITDPAEIRRLDEATRTR